MSSQCIRSGYLRLLSLCQDVIAMCGSHHTAGENITTWQTGAPLCSLGCQQSVSLHSAFSQSSQVLTNPVSFTQTAARRCPVCRCQKQSRLVHINSDQVDNTPFPIRLTCSFPMATPASESLPFVASRREHVYPATKGSVFKDISGKADL